MRIEAYMDIVVTCPSCMARFKVSEKFAEQTGPCPKCKKPIRVPEQAEEVVIHAPEEFGPKDSSGRGVLKPIEREETEASPVAITAMVAACLVVLVAAFFLGRAYPGPEKAVPMLFLGLGAVLLGPPLAVAGYGLMRDAELEPYRGGTLWLRAILCGLAYAALWGGYWYIKQQLFDGDVEMFHLVFVAPVLVALGAIAPLATLDLDYSSGAMHYGLYLLVTCLLRLLMGMPVY